MVADLITPWKIRRKYSKDASVVLFHGDAAKFLTTIPDKTVSLIVTSPPYNIGKSYEQRAALDEYLANQSHVISQFGRILRDNGSVCWQVGSYIKGGEVFPLDILFYDTDLSLKFRVAFGIG
ncbi:MAG TPA: DNA methyltransferase [Xanthomonadales bacterium]|nr:DNA methyltransferase [Xanthomonadales bacterium]